MWRLLFILSFCPFLDCRSASVQHCECPNVTTSIQQSRLCFLEEETRLKLKERANKLNVSQTLLASRLKEILKRLKQQTKDLNNLKLMVSSHFDANGANKDGFLYEHLARTRFIQPTHPGSCAQATGITRTTGLYAIQVDAFSKNPFLVFCNEDVDGGGWTVIQRRVKNSFGFDRDWESYKVGFGNLIEDFFIGLDKLHAMTREPQELLIILTDFEGIRGSAKYDRFAIGPEKDFYRLKDLGKFTGYIGDSLSYHKGMNFSTKDKNTNTITTRQCPTEFKGGWWYNNCLESNLNGLHLDKHAKDPTQGIIWYSWHNFNYSFKSVEMLIRPKREEFCFSKRKYPNSCDDIALRQSEIVMIQVPTVSPKPFKVYCNMEEEGGGWTVIQRRVDDSVDFFLDWASYKAGFGDLNGNFFIGLDKLHDLTEATSQELLVVLTDFDDVTKIAKYTDFAIGDESEFYALNVVGEYSGTAGDSLSRHKGMKFSTKGQDNDVTDKWNCAESYQSAWWYKDCIDSDLNGPYQNRDDTDYKWRGIIWFTFIGDIQYPLKRSEMMIRPKMH